MVTTSTLTPPSQRASSFVPGSVAAKLQSGATTIQRKRKGKKIGKRETFVEIDGKPTKVLSEDPDAPIQEKEIQRREFLDISPKAQPKFAQGIEQARRETIESERAQLINTARALQRQGFLLKQNEQGEFEVTDIRPEDIRRERFQEQERIIRDFQKGQEARGIQQERFFGVGIAGFPTEREADFINFLGGAEQRRQLQEQTLESNLPTQSNIDRENVLTRFNTFQTGVGERIFPGPFEETIAGQTVKRGGATPFDAIPGFREKTEKFRTGADDFSEGFQKGTFKELKQRPVTTAGLLGLGIGIGFASAPIAAAGAIGKGTIIGLGATGSGLFLGTTIAEVAGTKGVRGGRGEVLGRRTVQFGAVSIGGAIGGQLGTRFITSKLQPKVSVGKPTTRTLLTSSGKEKTLETTRVFVKLKQPKISKSTIKTKKPISFNEIKKSLTTGKRSDLLELNIKSFTESGTPGKSGEKVFTGVLSSKELKLQGKIIGVREPIKGGFKTSTVVDVKTPQGTRTIELFSATRGRQELQLLGKDQLFVAEKRVPVFFTTGRAFPQGSKSFVFRQKGVSVFSATTKAGQENIFVSQSIQPSGPRKVGVGEAFLKKLPFLGLQQTGTQGRLVTGQKIVPGTQSGIAEAVARSLGTIPKTPGIAFGAGLLATLGGGQRSITRPTQKVTFPREQSLEPFTIPIFKILPISKTQPAIQQKPSTRQQPVIIQTPRTGPGPKQPTEIVNPLVPPAGFTFPLPTGFFQSKKDRKRKGAKRKGKFTQTLFGVFAGAPTKGVRRIFTGFELIRKNK